MSPLGLRGSTGAHVKNAAELLEVFPDFAIFLARIPAHEHAPKGQGKLACSATTMIPP